MKILTLFSVVLILLGLLGFYLVGKTKIKKRERNKNNTDKKTIVKPRWINMRKIIKKKGNIDRKNIKGMRTNRNIGG